MTSSRARFTAREFGAILLGVGATLGGCVVSRPVLPVEEDAFSPTDAARDAPRLDAPNDVSGDVGSDGGIDAGEDVGNDVGMDASEDVGGDVGGDVGSDVGSDAGSDVGTDASVGPTGLIARWPFEAMAPGPLSDVTRNGHDLAQLGSAVMFPMGVADFGPGEGLFASPSPDFNGVRAVSLHLRVAVVPSAGFRRPILTSTNQLSLSVTEDGSITCGFGSEEARSGRDMFRSSFWAAIVCSYDGAALSLSVSTAAGSETVSTSATRPSPMLSRYVIGGGTGNSAFSGRIDEVTLWDRPLSSDELAAFIATRPTP